MAPFTLQVTVASATVLFLAISALRNRRKGWHRNKGLDVVELLEAIGNGSSVTEVPNFVRRPSLDNLP